MALSKSKVVILSPFVIITINFCVAYLAGHYIGKWAFIPIILIEWCLFLLMILRYTNKTTRKKWLQKPQRGLGWNILALFIGMLPLPLFLMHYETLSSWSVFIPWLLLALINPWLEEFYWRGLLLDYTNKWPSWVAILFSSAVFALNHAVFGVNSVLNSGMTVIISTFIMGVIWALVYKKTNSLRWIIPAHFLVDAFNLSAASFLDLYEKGSW